MIIVDAHQDIAYNALQYGREYSRSAWATRRAEAEAQLDQGLVANGLPDALLGRLAVVFCTLFVEPSWSPFTPNKKFAYDTPRQAYRGALRQWDYYQRLADEHERIDLVRTQAELDAVLATWEEGTYFGDHHIGLVLAMEGAEPVLAPGQLEEWVARGLRVLGPAWTETRYAGSTDRPGPLTGLGHELLEVMADNNMVLDLSHMAEEAYYEALDCYEGPVIASHSNPAAFWDDPRNLTDDQIRRMAERDGVIGIVIYNRFINKRWYPGAPKLMTPFAMLLDMIDHICQVTGSAAHVGIGSDVDGGFGAEDIPAGIDTVMDFLKIGQGLLDRGYAPDDVDNIMSDNFLRVLRRALP